VALGLRLTWLALRLRPDVLYAFKPKAYAGLCLLIFWLLRRRGLIRTTIALDADDWEGGGGWVDREPRTAAIDALVSWHERWCIRHADVVTAASRELIDRASRLGAKVVYVPNAASPTSPGWRIGRREVPRAALGLGDAPLILAYTRFVEFAPRRLVDTFEQIRRQAPWARLLVVGKGLGNEDATFAALVHERGLDAAVHQVGWAKLRDLPDYFAAADVALYPMDDTQLNRAKCPMKLVDLLLGGVPVVVDRVGEVSEYVSDGLSGCVVPTGDVTAMVDATVGLLLDDARRLAISRAARASVLARWTWATQGAVVERALSAASRVAG